MDSRSEGLSRFRAVVLTLGALAVASAALAGGSAWKRLGPDGGQVNALAFDPSASATLYAATDRGVFKSRDAGRSWAAMNVGLTETRVFSLVLQPSAPATLYAGTTAGVFKTTNGGGSWKLSNAGVPIDHAVVALAIDPKTPATLYAGTNVYFCEDFESCLFKSINGGTSWSALHVPTKPYPLSLAIDPVTPKTLYVGASDGAYKSIDGGQSWARMDLTAFRVSALAVDPSDPATLYAATATSYYETDGGVFKSTDGGDHWTAMNAGLPSKAVHALALDPSAPGTLYAGTIGGGVLKSSDGAETWVAMNAGLTYTNVFVLAVDPADPARVYSGTRGAVFAYEKLPDAAPCVPDATTLCLNDGRFQVRTEWATRDGSSGPGQARALTGDTGYFTFFDPDNVELMVKVLNGCGTNGRFWTFAGGLTNVSVVMTVTDINTGAVNTYTNPQDTPFQPVQDIDAFAICDSLPQQAAHAPPSGYAKTPLVAPIVAESFDASAAPCVADATTLCLNDSRFKVQAQWFTPDGKSGAGQVIPLTEDTGAFWFFSASNVEVVIKALNGCSVNSRYWTFAGGLTNVDVTLTVTDTQTGNVKTYTNAQGTPFPPIQDTGAFVACP